MRTSPGAFLTGALTAAAGFVAARHGNAAAPVDWSSAQRIEIRMIEYELIPNELRLRRGDPYQLHLVNTGKEGHDFTAPDFFNSVEVKNAGVLGASGTSIFLQPAQTTDVYFIARNAGLFAPRCADHDWAGMTATIVID
jgi:plastocyanin